MWGLLNLDLSAVAASIIVQNNDICYAQRLNNSAAERNATRGSSESRHKMVRYL